MDNANVLETSRLWREIVHCVHDADYADVELEDLLVDNTGPCSSSTVPPISDVV